MKRRATLGSVCLWAILCSSTCRRSTAFSPTTLRRWRSSQQGARCLVSAASVLEGDTPITDEDDILHIDEGGNEKTVISKARWKKKRFLMLKDVNAAIQNGDKRAVRKAQEVVRRMWQLFDLTKDDDFKPNLQVYNLLIHAIAKSKTKDNGKMAESVIHEMIHHGIKPSVVSYTSVMDAYANQARFDPKAPEHAEKVLFDLIDKSEVDHSFCVTSVTADVAMNAWAQQGTWDGAMRAEQILNRMENMASSLRPSVHSYATVIHGWAQAKGGTEAAQRAERLLNGLLRRDEVDVLPDTVVFNAVIDAWSSSGDPRAGTKALGWLNKMKELKNSKGYDCEPDSVTFNTVLSAWSHSGHVNAAAKSEKILQSMLDDHKNDPDSCPSPNTVSYNCVLHAWGRSTSDLAVSRAENILQYMIKSEDEHIAPDIYSFTSVLNALAKSKEPNKAARAREYLDMMIQMHQEYKRKSLAPTQVPFNAVLNAAAFSALGTSEEEQRKALKTAVETFSLMKKLGIHPDTISYGNMLKVVANLVPKGKTRTEMGMQLFQACCQDGLVGDLVWNEARRALPANVLNEVVPARKPLAALQPRNLPRSWTKNVPRERRMYRRPNSKHARKEDHEDPVEAKRREPVRKYRPISEQSYQSGRDV